jgi:hypothetical protein
LLREENQKKFLQVILFEMLFLKMTLWSPEMKIYPDKTLLSAGLQELTKEKNYTEKRNKKLQIQL